MRPSDKIVYDELLENTPEPYKSMLVNIYRIGYRTGLDKALEKLDKKVQKESKESFNKGVIVGSNRANRDIKLSKN